MEKRGEGETKKGEKEYDKRRGRLKDRGERKVRVHKIIEFKYITCEQ